MAAQDLWITGSAVPGGAQKLEKVADNDYKYAGRLNAGELRVATAKKPRKGTRFFSPVLMDANLVTCIASDAHSSRQRTPRLEGGYRQIASRYGEWTADLLLRGHPERMIRNEPLEVRGYARPVAPFSME